jgi:MarR family transcriptional regulator, temperature-dependent positive regulator of motility
MLMLSQPQRAERAADVSASHDVPPRLARRFHQICVGVLSELTEPCDLSPIQFGALASLHKEPGIDQRGLARVMGIDAVSTHHLVDELEARGLLHRDINPEDRRGRVLNLTAKGTRLLLKLLPQARAAHDQILGSLSAAECRTFLTLLKRVVDANQKYARPGNGRRRPGRKAEKPIK